jgi:hypothetical protein
MEESNMAKKHAVQEILDVAGQFVIAQKGDWDHAAWEEFLVKIAGLGIELCDESKRNLGNILEATKSFYGKVPCCEGGCAIEAAPKPAKKAAAKKAPTKKKAVAKKKPTA